MNTKEFRQCLENIAIHFFTLSMKVVFICTSTLHYWKLYLYEQALYAMKVVFICTSTFLFLRSATSYLSHKNELKRIFA